VLLLLCWRRSRQHISLCKTNISSFRETETTTTITAKTGEGEDEEEFGDEMSGPPSHKTPPSSSSHTFCLPGATTHIKATKIPTTSRQTVREGGEDLLMEREEARERAGANASHTHHCAFLRKIYA